MKRSHRNGIRIPTREPVPYISPGVPEHIDDLVLSSAQVQRRPLTNDLVDVAMDPQPDGSIVVRAKRRAISPCTPAQRARAKAMGCVVTGATEGVDPLHLIPRGLTTVGQDELLAIVGCRRDIHRAYDLGDFDLLPYLTGRHDDAVAFAVERVGLITALERITNTKWAPMPSTLGREARY